jgi:hypothetical protein
VGWNLKTQNGFPVCSLTDTLSPPSQPSPFKGKEQTGALLEVKS